MIFFSGSGNVKGQEDGSPGFPWAVRWSVGHQPIIIIVYLACPKTLNNPCKWMLFIQMQIWKLGATSLSSLWHLSGNTFKISVLYLFYSIKCKIKTWCNRACKLCKAVNFPDIFLYFVWIVSCLYQMSVTIDLLWWNSTEDKCIVNHGFNRQ